MSDHKAVFWKLRDRNHLAANLIEYYSKADYDGIQIDMIEQPFKRFCWSNPNKLLHERHSWLLPILERRVPTPTNHRTKLKPWMSSETSHKLIKLETLEHKLRRKGTEVLRVKLASEQVAFEKPAKTTKQLIKVTSPKAAAHNGRSSTRLATGPLLFIGSIKFSLSPTIKWTIKFSLSPTTRNFWLLPRTDQAKICKMTSIYQKNWSIANFIDFNVCRSEFSMFFANKC